MGSDVTAVVECELGGPPDRVERVPEGLLRETYAVERDGEAYVVQFADDDEDQRAAIRRGLGCYRLLADTAVPVPDVVTGSVREHDGRPYVVVERLRGTSGERDVSPARARDAGRHLARLHEVAGFDESGPLGFDATAVGGAPSVDPYDTPLRERLRERTAASARTLAAGGLEEAGRAVEQFLERTWTPPRGAFQPVLCHGDFTPDNLLFDGDDVVGVLDFDRARAGDPRRDLVRAANAVWMHDPCADWDPRAAVYEGYRAERDPGEGFAAVEPRYRVTTLARTVAGMVELDELTDYERGFYDEHLVAAVERAGERR